MPISDWFKAREERRYVTPGPPGESADLPDGVWILCDGCKKTFYKGDLEESLEVCPGCSEHHEVPSPDRVAMLVDAGSFEEMHAGISSLDPLSFESGKPYTESLAKAKDKTGLPEAVLTGRAAIGGHPVVIGVMDFRFIGASMGSAVGEKIARAFETALADGRPLVLVTASGGARMQEGMLSLMQMAKTSAAAVRLSEARVPYIAVLTNPTTGGVTASFATLADVIIAGPGALVGFAGPALVEQTIRRALPRGFQRSEFVLEHGMIDAVVDRREMRETLTTLLDYLSSERGC